MDFLHLALFVYVFVISHLYMDAYTRISVSLCVPLCLFTSQEFRLQLVSSEEKFREAVGVVLVLCLL